MAVRIQLRRTKGWRMPPNTVKVDRTTRWGNPYIVERLAGQLWDPATSAWTERWELRCKHWMRGTVYQSQAAALKVSLAYFRDEVAPYLKTEELEGKNLACWCGLCERHRDGKPLDEHCADCAPCHADTLGALANQRESA